MELRLDERLASPYFSPSGDARAPYETHGTTFLQYLARRAAKTRVLLPLATLLREQRAGFCDARLQLRALRCLFRAEHFHEGLKSALGIRKL